MDCQLHPVTEAGERFVKLTEDHMAELAAGADLHDRQGTFPAEHFESMRSSGVLAACVPEEFGGLGVESLHDLTVGMNRLGRADASTAICAQMHIAAGWQFTRALRDAIARGDEQAVAIQTFLGMLGEGSLVLTVANTERGTSHGFPLTDAVRAPGGWVLNGRKIFATNSPVASMFVVGSRVRDEAGHRTALAFVPRETTGLEVVETWDAMGMRASGSHDVVLTDCFVPEPMVFDAGPWGVLDEFWITFYTAGNIGLLGVFLGLAEAARDAAVGMATSRRKAPTNRTLAEGSSVQHAVAQMEVGIAASRALVARTCLALDSYFSKHLASEADHADLTVLMKEFICTKQFVNRTAIEVVDHALTISGGAGYLSSNSLSRLYRDVRAGPFMQPYSPNESLDYIGKVALGLTPALDR